VCFQCVFEFTSKSVSLCDYECVLFYTDDIPGGTRGGFFVLMQRCTVIVLDEYIGWGKSGGVV
jgi:hypothetical protein